MLNNMVITDIINFSDNNDYNRIFIDLDYKKMFLDQEYSFTIVLNDKYSNESKIEVNILVNNIQNNKIELGIIAISKNKYQIPVFIRFCLIWHYTGHYEIEYISTFNKNVILPEYGIEYAKYQIDELIIPCLFKYKQDSINNLN